MKIHSNQFISENVEPFPNDGVFASNKEWWFIYDNETKKVFGDPIKSFSRIRSPLTIVIADTLKECEDYILTNELINLEYEYKYDDTIDLDN